MISGESALFRPRRPDWVAVARRATYGPILSAARARALRCGESSTAIRLSLSGGARRDPQNGFFHRGPSVDETMVWSNSWLWALRLIVFTVTLHVIVLGLINTRVVASLHRIKGHRDFLFALRDRHVHHDAACHLVGDAGTPSTPSRPMGTPSRISRLTGSSWERWKRSTGRCPLDLPRPFSTRMGVAD
jgi:hypothetical protein